MGPLRRLRSWRGPPLSLQILGLLLGGLVVAQVVTLFLTVLLPPAPPPQYGLGDIAAALKGDAAGRSALERRTQAAAPDVTGPGWLVSERSRDDLAALLGAAPEDVRLSFYTPLPFAGVTAPPRRPDPIAEGAGPIGLSPQLVPASILIFAQAGPGGGLPGGGVPGGIPGGGFPRGGFPGGGFPGGMPGGSFPGGGFPGGSGGGFPGSGRPQGLPNGGGFPGAQQGSPQPQIGREAALPPVAAPEIARQPMPVPMPQPRIATPDLIRTLPPIEPRQTAPEVATPRATPTPPAPAPTPQPPAATAAPVAPPPATAAPDVAAATPTTPAPPPQAEAPAAVSPQFAERPT